jgi:hypothetical protein
MARQSPNPDRDFSAGYARDPEIDRLMNEPAPLWDDILDDPVFGERIGKLIADAIRRYTKTDLY